MLGLCCLQTTARTIDCSNLDCTQPSAINAEEIISVNTESKSDEWAFNYATKGASENSFTPKWHMTEGGTQMWNITTTLIWEVWEALKPKKPPLHKRGANIRKHIQDRTGKHQWFNCIDWKLHSYQWSMQGFLATSWLMAIRTPYRHTFCLGCLHMGPRD